MKIEKMDMKSTAGSPVDSASAHLLRRIGGRVDSKAVEK
jgi:hypothetical protein